MAGPLAVAVASWVMMQRTYQRSPERLTGVMTAAFGAKLVFFAAYVVIMLRGLSLRPIAFVASFAAYFVGLYALEALFLKRLLAGRGPAA
jgi:hypothetical protein